MGFTCHTTYNQKALTAMARAVRKTLRAKTNRGALPGTDAADTTFYPDRFLVKTGATETRWLYSRILALAETREYLVFVMEENTPRPWKKPIWRAAVFRNSAALWQKTPAKIFKTLEDKSR